MPSLIELDDIHFAYPLHEPVLRGVGLRLDAGERLCLTGFNGAGKSTLLRIVLGLIPPQRGRVVAFSQERRREADFLEVRRRAGMVFQDADDQLFCPTVAEDVAFGPLNLGKTCGETLAVVDAVLDRLGILHLRDRITYKLSGGEKRLVPLAAVLAMEPEVLLLDEPTTALDEPATERLIEILLTLPQAMIVVSHDPRFRERVATRTLRLENGLIAAPEASSRPDAPV